MAHNTEGPGFIRRYIPGTTDRGAWGILSDASKIDPMKIGKYVKDNAYDVALAAQSAERGVGCFTNIATLGIAGFLAHRRTNRAKDIADMVRYSEQHGAVGRIKDMGCITRLAAIGVIGLFSVLGIKYVLPDGNESAPQEHVTQPSESTVVSILQGISSAVGSVAEKNTNRAHQIPHTRWDEITKIQTSVDAQAVIPLLQGGETYRLCIGTCLFEEEMTGQEMADHLINYFKEGQVHSPFSLQKSTQEIPPSESVPTVFNPSDGVFSTIDEFHQSISRYEDQDGKITVTAENYPFYSYNPDTFDRLVGEVEALITAGHGPVHITVVPSF